MNRGLILSIVVVVILSTVANAYEHASVRQTTGGCQNLNGIVDQNCFYGVYRFALCFSELLSIRSMC